MQTATAIRSRRTIKNYTGATVDRPTLTTLLDLAAWAPTHRMTQPWRFTVLDQPALRRLDGYLRQEPQIAAVPDPTKGAAKLAKLLERLHTLGAMITVTWKRHPEASIDLEDHAAASAAVQNLLLAATDLGLGTFWSTNPALGHPLTLRWCGIDPDQEGYLGSIWIGVADEHPPAPPRLPQASVVRWL